MQTLINNVSKSRNNIFLKFTMNHLIIYCECLKNKVEILAIEPSFLRVSNSFAPF